MAPTKNRKVEEEMQESIPLEEHNKLKSDYDKLKQEKDQQSRKLQDEKEEQIQKLEEKTKKLEELTKKVEERVECPVCLEVPTAGPLHTCPNGHIICHSCFQGPASDCPVCRARMGSGISLLGAAVIETIEHSCRLECCKVKVPLAEVEQHKKACGYRLISCPAVHCKKKIALCHVMDHVMNTCEGSIAKFTGSVSVVGESNTRGFLFLWNPEFSSFLHTTSWEDNFFFVTLHSRPGAQYGNIYVQMLGTQEECGKYKVTIGLEDGEGGNNVVTFRNNPSVIGMAEEEKDDAGLVVIHIQDQF